MRAVMYHYVRKHDSNFPYFRFLDLNNFRRQLDYSEKKFGFVGPDEWHAFFIDGIEPSKKRKGWVESAATILVSMRIHSLITERRDSK